MSSTGLIFQKDSDASISAVALPESRWLPLAALLPSWLAVAWLVSKAQWYWSHRPDLQFGWVVLMLCGYLFWEAWEKRPATAYRWTFSIGALLLFGAGLLFLVQIYQAAFGMKPASLLGLALALFLLVGANVAYVFGRKGVWHFGFAFGFLLIAFPMPSALHNLVVGGLQSKVAVLNVELLNLIGIPARRMGSLIQLPNCTVGVDEACSGIRSLQSALMATLFIGYLSLSRFSLRLVLVGAGILLAIIGNLARSFFLSYTANASGIEVLETAHDAAGWSILLFTAAGVAVVAWLFSKLENNLPPDSNHAGR
jgi:exosortase